MARGFDFEFARLIFDGPTLERPDDRKNYGEKRAVAIGRIILARRGNRRERKAYSEAIAKG